MLFGFANNSFVALATLCVIKKEFPSILILVSSVLKYVILIEVPGVAGLETVRRDN